MTVNAWASAVTPVTLTVNNMVAYHVKSNNILTGWMNSLMVHSENVENWEKN